MNRGAMTPLAFFQKLVAVRFTSVQQGTGWFKMPGGRLELGESGFVIQLRTDPKHPPYLLTDPDGRDLALGFLLQPLKEYAEQHARDRAEIAP